MYSVAMDGEYFLFKAFRGLLESSLDLIMFLRVGVIGHELYNLFRQHKCNFCNFYFIFFFFTSTKASSGV